MGFEFGFGSGTKKFGFTPGTVSGFRVPPNYITITCIAIVDWINIPSENKSMHHWSNKILELGIQNILARLVILKSFVCSLVWARKNMNAEELPIGLVVLHFNSKAGNLITL